MAHATTMKEFKEIQDQRFDVLSFNKELKEEAGYFNIGVADMLKYIMQQQKKGFVCTVYPAGILPNMSYKLHTPFTVFETFSLNVFKPFVVHGTFDGSYLGSDPQFEFEFQDLESAKKKFVEMREKIVGTTIFLEKYDKNGNQIHCYNQGIVLEGE